MAQPARNQTGRALVARFTEQLEAGREKLRRSLPATVDVDRFIDVAQTAVMKNAEEMQQCTMESLFLAVKQCAQAGLMPDGQESAIVRYGTEAVWMPMVQGIIRLMLRSADVAKVEARIVRQGDIFEYHYGLRPALDHRPVATPTDQPFGPDITHAYAIIFWRDLGPEHATFEVVTRQDIEQARNASRASNSPAWRNWYGEMARKVALHRIKKYVDLSPEAQQAIQADVAAGWDDDAPIPAGLSLEEKMAAKAELDTAGLRQRFQLQAGGGQEASEETSEEGASGPAEPTEEQSEAAESAKADNWRKLIDGLHENEGPLDREDVLDASEKLFGGRKGVERTEAGFVDLDALGAADLRTLYEELSEVAGAV